MMDLRQGDCLELMKDIPDKSIDMILCDLPYGTTACKWDVVIPFEELWEQYNRIIKDNGAIVLFGSQPFTSQLILSNIKMFREELIWLKNKSGSGLQAKQKHIKIHENILVFTKNGKFIKEWNCIRDVEKELGINHSNISSCCKGKLYKSVGGYIWKYKEEFDYA